MRGKGGLGYVCKARGKHAWDMRGTFACLNYNKLARAKHVKTAGGLAVCKRLLLGASWLLNGDAYGLAVAAQMSV